MTLCTCPTAASRGLSTDPGHGHRHEKSGAALSALEKIEEPQLLVPQLVAEFNKNGFVRTWHCRFEIACVEYFGRQGAQAKDAVPLLVKHMRARYGVSVGDESLYLQQRYIEALARIGPAAKEALPALQEIATMSQQDVLKTAANKAIKMIALEK